MTYPFPLQLAREYLGIDNDDVHGIGPHRVGACFISLGEPKSKARARIGEGGAYTPDSTTAAENAIAWAFLEQVKGWKVDATTVYGVAMVFDHASRQRRDVDNMVKLVLDALNGVAWADDVQVAEVSARKQLVPKGEEATRVAIYSLPEIGTTAVEKACPVCGTSFRVFPSTRSQVFCSPACHGQDRRVDKVCEHCGTGFHGRGRSVYCSAECGQEALRVDAECAVCGAAIRVLRSIVAKGQRVFCSDECRQEYWRPIRAKNAKGVCVGCGGPTSKKAYRRCARCASGAFPDAQEPPT